jgi:hypothetical protein
VEVESGGGEDSITAVAVLPLEVIAAHPVLGLDVADDRLDCGPSSTWMRRSSAPVFFLRLATATASERKGANRCLSAGSPAILRLMSRMSRPRRVRRKT